LLKGEKLIPSHDQSNYQIGYPLDKRFSVGYARKLRTEKQIIRKLIDCPIMKVKIEWNDLMSTVLLIWFNSDLTFKHQNTCILTESMILYVSNFLPTMSHHKHTSNTLLQIINVLQITVVQISVLQIKSQLICPLVCWTICNIGLIL